MSKLLVHPATTRHAWQRLVVALVLLLSIGLVSGQATDPTLLALSRLVRLAPGTRPLGIVLAELSRQSRLPFSYSSSLVPLAHPCSLAAGPARPLGAVLAEVLAAEQLSFGLLNGQLVLWPLHLAVPAGVVVVNGRPARAEQPARELAISRAALAAMVLATGAATVTAGNTAPEGRFHSPSGPMGKPRKLFSAASTNDNARIVTQPETTIAHGSSSAQRLPTSLPAAAAASQPLPRALRPSCAEVLAAPTSSTAKTASPSGTFLARRGSAKARNEAAAAIQPSAVQRSVRATRQVGSSPARSPLRSFLRKQTAAPPTTSIGQPGGQPEVVRTSVAETRQQPTGAVRGPVALLTARAILPFPVPESDALPLLLQPPAGQKSAPPRSPSASPDILAPAVAKTPFALARLLRSSYLHAEAWSGETLPLNAAVKVGIPRIYLVLGVAAGPSGRQSGGLARGIGLGTVGQLRGRFTPSLDLMQWFLLGDQGISGPQLTQLRPLVAWQVKQGGRLQIMGGPSLNLAIGRRGSGPGGGAPPPRQDDELGQGQWLWLDSGDDRSFLRLWPGIQVGLRF